MRAWCGRHPVVAFVVLAFFGSWMGWSPWWLSQSGLGVLPFQMPLGGIALVNQVGLFAGPFLTAYLLTRWTEGPDGTRGFWARLVQWRVPPAWYVLALVAISLAVAVPYLVAPGAEVLPEMGPGPLAATLTVTFVLFLVGGPIQEEPGWRGFVLPRLQQAMHPSAAALLLGVIHCAWHAPLFLTREWDTARADPSQYLAYLIMVVGLSFVLSWLANGADGSVLLAILGHNSVNWALMSVGLVTGDAPSSSTWPAALGMTVLAAVAVIATRGRLAYRPMGEQVGEARPA